MKLNTHGKCLAVISPVANDRMGLLFTTTKVSEDKYPQKKEQITSVCPCGKRANDKLWWSTKNANAVNQQLKGFNVFQWAAASNSKCGRSFFFQRTINWSNYGGQGSLFSMHVFINQKGSACIQMERAVSVFQPTNIRNTIKQHPMAENLRGIIFKEKVGKFFVILFSWRNWIKLNYVEWKQWKNFMKIILEFCQWLFNNQLQ